MLTISADVSSMCEAQREALAGFIRTFPQNNIEIPDPKKAFTPALTDSHDGPQLVVPEPSSPNQSNLDKAGLPWDERIHSSSKALTADGFWRKKRGIDDSKVVEVETQLKQLMALPTPVVQVPPPPPPAPVVVDGKQAFITLVNRVSTAIPEKKITMEEVLKACNDAGVAALPLLANRTDLIPQVAMTIEALIASR